MLVPSMVCSIGPCQDRILVILGQLYRCQSPRRTIGVVNTVIAVRIVRGRNAVVSIQEDGIRVSRVGILTGRGACCPRAECPRMCAQLSSLHQFQTLSLVRQLAHPGVSETSLTW